MKNIFWAISAVSILLTAFFLFLSPILSVVFTTSLGRPTQISGARWTGRGELLAKSLQVGLPDKSLLVAKNVHVRGFFGWLFGGPLQVHIERLESSAGQARGGFLWNAGHLEKISARIVLTEAGFKRIPKLWAKRISLSSAGHVFIMAYASNRLVLRGRGKPILEAVWKPA